MNTHTRSASPIGTHTIDEYVCRAKLKRQKKENEQQKEHKVVLDTVRDFGRGMKECYDDLHVLQMALRDAEEAHGVHYDMPRRVQVWLPGNLDSVARLHDAQTKV